MTPARRGKSRRVSALIAIPIMPPLRRARIGGKSQYANQRRRDHDKKMLRQHCYVMSSMPGPADAHEQKGEICLPWRSCVTDLDNTAGQGDSAKRNDRARTLTFDTTSNRYQKQRTDYVEKGHGARDEAGRPAILRHHLMEIDTRAKQAERISD